MDSTLIKQPDMAETTSANVDAGALIDQAHLRSKAFGIATDDCPDHSGLPITQLKGALEETVFSSSTRCRSWRRCTARSPTRTAWCC